ncbi:MULTISPECIES: hypothetical protein [Paenibacillus]|uniref:hypothetical protein n=1 Tax=Paenibacillus TaxID=44249 RepID=UPI002FE2E9DA
MAFNTEYAKLVRIKTDNLNDRGFKAKIKLPNSKTLPRAYDYINFYVGINGYECGISIADRTEFKPNGAWKWRIFANGEGNTKKGEKSGDFFNDGDIVTLSIELNEQNKVVYKVNDAVFRSFDETVTNVVNSARLVIATNQDTGYTPPLKQWSVFHDQVRAYEMKYKNSSNNWVAFTMGNKVQTEEWPLGVATPDRRKYILDKTWIGNADVYASLKNL